MRERVYRTEAVIIRRADFGEADRVLTLITPQGKRRVVAKGARKTTSRLAGHIELFTHATLLLAVGRNLDIVTQSVILHSFQTLRGELRLLGLVGYRPNLYHCAVCQEALTEETQRFSPEAGGALCPRCAPSDRAALPISLSAFKLLRFLQAQPLDAIERLNISPATREEAEKLMRVYLRRILERDLKSITFLEQISNS